MKLIPWTLPVALGVLLSLAGESAQAQPTYQPYVSPAGRPTITPYINLFNRGANPGVTYFGIVRPELQTNAALRQLRQDVNANETALNSDQATGQLYTGHTVQFLNTTHYFQNYTGAGPGARAGGPGVAQAVSFGAGAVGTGLGSRPTTGLNRPTGTRR